MTAALIRPATDSDAARIAEINVVTWQTAYAGLVPDEVLDNLSVAQRTERWREIIDRGDDVLVTAVDEEVVGYAGVGPCRDDDIAAGTGELYAIYLDPEFWDRGLGHQLHDAAMAALATAGFDGATLWVLDTNARAIGFYGRHGWVADGSAKDDARGGAVLREVRLVRPAADQLEAGVRSTMPHGAP